MQIKRLLNDRLVVAGDGLINGEGEHCESVEHADGQLVAVLPDGKEVRNSPVKFGCHLLIKDWTGGGLTKQRLRSFGEDSLKSEMTKQFGGTFIITNAYSFI